MNWFKPVPIDAELQERIVQQAREFAEEQRWPWLEPVEVTGDAYAGDSVWVVKTNTTSKGCNIRVAIRKSDCEIVQSGFLSR